jgi:hypothetical protein
MNLDVTEPAYPRHDLLRLVRPDQPAEQCTYLEASYSGGVLLE